MRKRPTPANILYEIENYYLVGVMTIKELCKRNNISTSNIQPYITQAIHNYKVNGISDGPSMPRKDLTYGEIDRVKKYYYALKEYATQKMGSTPKKKLYDELSKVCKWLRVNDMTFKP